MTLLNCWTLATASWLGIAKSQRCLRSKKTECVDVSQCLTPPSVSPSASVSSPQLQSISGNVAVCFCSYTPLAGKDLATPQECRKQMAVLGSGAKFVLLSGSPC